LKRLPGLDLLRGIAIVWVMMFHAYVVDGLNERFAAVQTYGWMGVDLFFVLSGYLIGSQLLAPLGRGEPLRPGEFYLRRAFRVLPAFWVVLALYAGWPALRETSGLAPAWQFLSFSLNLLIDYQRDRAFSHAWSLCVEEHFYLLCPWLAWWLCRRPSLAKAMALGLALVAAGMAVRAWAWLHWLAPVQGLDDDRYGVRFVEHIYYPTWARLDGLLAGVALAAAKVYRPQAWARWQGRANLVALAGLAVVAAAMALFRDRLGFAASVFGYPLLALGMGLLVLAGAGGHGWLGRRLPMAGWLARISYSLYLSHKLAMHLVYAQFGPALQGRPMLAFVAYAVAVLAAGALLYYGVERPFLRLRDRLDRRAAALPAAA
jgi:peptidoglycan/LPS O-acetylase OafA/YrhL